MHMMVHRSTPLLHLPTSSYIWITGRVDDVLNVSGHRLGTAEIESALVAHPDCVEAAVIGIPHEMWGEQVHAVVVLAAGTEATEEELQAFAKESIAGYKVPKSVEFRSDPLPLSGAMKVLKKDLRAPYWEGHGRGVN